jgi:hypothetical protein
MHLYIGNCNEILYLLRLANPCKTRNIIYEKTFDEKVFLFCTIAAKAQ